VQGFIEARSASKSQTLKTLFRTSVCLKINYTKKITKNIPINKFSKVLGIYTTIRGKVDMLHSADVSLHPPHVSYIKSNVCYNVTNNKDNVGEAMANKNFKIVNIGTGEVHDKPPFIQMFLRNAGKALGLTSTQGLLLGVMARDCMYGNHINMTPKRKKVYVTELKLASQNSLNGVLKALERSNIVRREEEGSTSYVINPNLLLKGNDYQYAALLTFWNKDNGTEFKVLNMKTVDIVQYGEDGEQENINFDEVTGVIKGEKDANT